MLYNRDVCIMKTQTWTKLKASLVTVGEGGRMMLNIILNQPMKTY